MLIDFKVKNYRSLRDEQLLSMVASKDRTLIKSNTAESGLKIVPRLLRSAVIYGQNAGGKSNLIKAMQYMRAVVIESASIMQPGQTFGVQPFRLDSDSSKFPTEFEITFMLKGIRHQYGFSITSERVVNEYLLVYKAFKPQLWFDRSYDAVTNEYNYKPTSFLKGQKALWESATRQNSLFLSMAVQLNSDQLRPIFDWFSTHLIIFNELLPLNSQLSIEMLKTPEGKESISHFMSAADISISDIELVTRRQSVLSMHADFVGGKHEMKNEEQDVTELLFHHVTDNGKAVFGLGDESTGTRNLLFLIGPILEMVQNGVTLIIDELDTSLHPLLVRKLVELLHNSETNIHGAQLIFSTHDTSLLDPDLFRRDQIWFVEKTRDQSSNLYPLSDFNLRKNELFERGYLIGRFGALPFFSDKLIKNNNSRYKNGS
jgi:AAA15 family ATPase/GTPase